MCVYRKSKTGRPRKWLPASKYAACKKKDAAPNNSSCTFTWRLKKIMKLLGMNYYRIESEMHGAGVFYVLRVNHRPFEEHPIK
jgi:hypothetical protein